MDGYRDQPVLTAAAWKGTEIGADDWIHYLTAQQLTTLYTDACRIKKARNSNYLLTTAADFSPMVFGDLSKKIWCILEGGRGFVLIRGVPVECYDEQAITLMFWGLGTHLGIAEPQDAAGNLLHHVRDTGKRLEQQSTLRAYQTNRAINFHNDGSDIFALLCLQQASCGGLSKLVSAVAVFNEILHRRPDLARLLQEPFFFDARGQQLVGAPPCQQVPIFNFHAGYLNVLYKREYIDLAQRLDGVPSLTLQQIEASDLMDTVCDELALTFELQPGDILIANNYDILHARSAFENRNTTGLERHMLRLWMSIPDGRPLPQVLSTTREFYHSYKRRMDEMGNNGEE